MNRIFMSVDVSNLYYTIRKRFGETRKIDYRRLQKYGRERGWVFRSIAYASEMNGKAAGFFDCIRMLGFDVKLKPVSKYIDNGKVHEKANWDVGMAIDIVKFSSHFDELILVCSDGDMIPVVKYVQEQGIRVHVLGCDINAELRCISDSHEEIGPALLEKTNASSEADGPAKTA